MSVAIPWLDRVLQRKEERAALLDTPPWSDDFRWQELLALVEDCQVYKIVPGALICREGAMESFLGVVLQGRLEVRKLDSEGVEKTIASLGAGRAFGEMSVIDAEPRSATLVASEPGLLLVLIGESFAALSENHPRVALKLLQRIARTLSQRLRHTSGQLADYMQGF